MKRFRPTGAKVIVDPLLSFTVHFENVLVNHK